MTSILLDQSQHIIDAAFACGSELKLEPLSVAVLDPGGHLVAFQRQDSASLMRSQIAIGKAAGALALGTSSRKIAEMASERPTFVASPGALAPQGLAPAAGGGIVTNAADEILGAVGVTGDTSDNDETCALAGIASVDIDANA